MNVQNTADFPVEIDFTALDTGSKQGALAGFKNRSGQSKAVGVKQPTNPDAITNIEFKHPEIIL